MPSATWNAYIDWADDGGWTGADDVSARLRATGITIERGRDQIRRIAPPMVSKASFTLDNRSKDYSYAYSGSPLAGKLDPFHRARLTATYAATPHNLFTGYNTDLAQNPVYNAGNVEVPCLGPLVWLRGAGVKISTPLYANITTDQALGYILDAAGYPSGGSYRVLDTGKTTFLYWWADKEDAWDAMLKVLRSEGENAAVYEDGDGKIHFESRHYRITAARSTTSQASFGPVAEPKMEIAGWKYDPRLQDVINDMTLTINTRTALGLASIWTGPTPLSLGVNESRAFVVDAGGDPFDSAACTAGGGDYTVSGGSVSSATLDRTSGGNANLTITAGAGGATVTGLRVRAVKYSKTSQSVKQSISVAASQARYGVRSYNESVWPELAANAAQDLINGIVSLYQAPRPIVRFVVNNANATRLAQILAREVSDRITVREDQTGLNRDFMVETIRHEVSEGGRVHRLIIGAEQAVVQGYGVWGTATWGFTSWGA